MNEFELSLEEFQIEMLRLNNLGRDKTQKHQEMFPAPKKDENGKVVNDNKGGRRYHAAGTDIKCSICKQIIEAHDKYMGLQKSAFGLTGIPFESMISAIKITVGVIRMIENGLKQYNEVSKNGRTDNKNASDKTKNQEVKE